MNNKTIGCKLQLKYDKEHNYLSKRWFKITALDFKVTQEGKARNVEVPIDEHLRIIYVYLDKE